MKAFGRSGWKWAVVIQCISYALAVVLLILLAVSVPAHWSSGVFQASFWGILPLLGGVVSYRATRRGLFYLAAWIAPPILLTAIYWGMTGIAPLSPMMSILCAILSIVGAAAGHEMNKRKGR